MKLHEQYQATRLANMPESDFKSWVIEEVEDLSNDFGQKPDSDMIMHVSRRLLSVLKTKYRSWYVGEVHAAFQSGLTGAYGSAHKVTVKTIFQFLRGAQNQLAGKKAAQAEEESDRKNAIFNPANTNVIDFLAWASANMICLEFINPKWDPIKEKRVAPEIIGLSEQFIEAKRAHKLESLRRRLKEKQHAYNEANEPRIMDKVQAL